MHGTGPLRAACVVVALLAASVASAQETGNDTGGRSGYGGQAGSAGGAEGGRTNLDRLVPVPEAWRENRPDGADTGPARRVRAEPRRRGRPSRTAPQPSRRQPARPQPARQAQATPPLPDARQNEIIAAGIDDAAIDDLTAQGYAVLQRTPVGLLDGDIVRLEVPDGTALADAQAAVAAAAPEALVDLNTLYTPTRAGCDGLACTQLSLVDWPRAARTAGRCGAGVTIAIVDTGINPEHGSLAEADVTLLPLLGGEPQRSRRSHGTAVAAVLVGSGDPRIQGLLPAARLIAVDAFEEDPEGRTHSDAFRLVSAIDLVHGKGPDVINLSLTGPANALLERAVAAVADDGVPLVAAVGNAGPAADPLYPAAYDRVIAATAVDADRRIYRRAVRGEHVDFAAPGVRVWTAASVRGARPKTGTSFAAPFVSGAAALARQQGASSPEAVMETLKRSAEDLGEGGRDPVFGWGLLNAAGLCGAAPAGADAVVAEASADADAADSFGLAGE